MFVKKENYFKDEKGCRQTEILTILTTKLILDSSQLLNFPHFIKAVIFRRSLYLMDCMIAVTSYNL